MGYDIEDVLDYFLDMFRLPVIVKIESNDIAGKFVVVCRNNEELLNVLTSPTIKFVFDRVAGGKFSVESCYDEI